MVFLFGVTLSVGELAWDVSSSTSGTFTCESSNFFLYSCCFNSFVSSIISSRGSCSSFVLASVLGRSFCSVVRCCSLAMRNVISTMCYNSSITSMSCLTNLATLNVRIRVLCLTLSGKSCIYYASYTRENRLLIGFLSDSQDFPS